MGYKDILLVCLRNAESFLAALSRNAVLSVVSKNEKQPRRC